MEVICLEVNGLEVNGLEVKGIVFGGKVLDVKERTLFSLGGKTIGGKGSISVQRTEIGGAGLKIFRATCFPKSASRPVHLVP